MAKTKPVIEIDGKRYMNTKTAADLWGIKQKTVADYCKTKKIARAWKVSNKIWYIPVDTIKPLTNTQIHQLLVLTLQLKNKPSLEIDWSVCQVDRSAIKQIYAYLLEQEFIESLPTCSAERIPYEIVLTSKGLDAATKFQDKRIPGFSEALTTWIPIVIDIASLAIQGVQLTRDI